MASVRDHRVDAHARRPGGGLPEPNYAAIGCEPDVALPVLDDGTHGLAGQTVLGGQRLEHLAVEAAHQAGIGPEPDVARPVQQHRPQGVVRQAITRGERAEGLAVEHGDAVSIAAKPHLPLTVDEDGPHHPSSHAVFRRVMAPRLAVVPAGAGGSTDPDMASKVFGNTPHEVVAQSV